MTREQMIDEAVRRRMKPVTMRRVLASAAVVEGIRRDCTPSLLETQELLRRYAHPSWFHGTIADRALSHFPGRVLAIRAEFRRIANRQAA